MTQGFTGANDGNVIGPASATDNALARYDATTGKLLQDSTVLVSDAGEMTNGSQPAFLGVIQSNVTNVTGNNTIYDMGTGTALTEIFDQGSDFTTAGVFTAPITGTYYVQMSVTFVPSSTAGMTSFTAQLKASNRNFRSLISNSTSTEPNRSNKFSTLADMDAADTCIARSFANGVGADTVDVAGAADPMTWFSGKLEC